MKDSPADPADGRAAPSSRSRGGAAAWVAAFGASALLCGGLCAGALRWTDPLNREAFDSGAWIAAGDLNYRVKLDRRAAMAGDLIRCHVPAGLTRDGVAELLGEPDEIVRPGDRWGWTLPPGVGAEMWVYSVGNFSLRHHDDTFVLVPFDDAGRTAGAEIGGG